MRQKKDWRDSLLTLAVLLSLFRGDIDEYMRGSFGNLPEVNEILLGQSAALTETQFHNLFNSFDGHRFSDVHPKNLDIDWHQRSVFTDLHTLYRENNQNSGDVTAFLLDRLESNAARPYPVVNLVQNPGNSNVNGNDNAGNTDSENNNDNNNNVDSTSSASAGGNVNEEDGSLGAVAAPPVAELSTEDMDLIESLWRQDIDMGLSREDAFGYKSELLEKPDHPEKLKPQEAWERFEYNIDGETGEFVPIPIQPQNNLVNSQQQQGQTVQTQQDQLPQQQQPAPQPTQTNNLSLEECLQLIDEEYSPAVTSPTESSSTFQSGLSPQEAEQRWHDLASIPELSYQLHTASTEATATTTTQFQAPQESAPNMMNMTQPAVENPFMMNATTNGNVNLQNATTNIGAQTLQQVDHNQVLQPPSVPPHEIPQHQPEIPFSPLSNFANLSLNASSPLAVGEQGMNFSSLLLPPDRGQIDGSFQSNLTSESGSLLLELLNEGVDEVNMDYDEQIQSLAEAFDVDSVADDDSGRGSRSPFEDLSDAASPFSDHGSSEGATGYNSSLENDQLKGASGGYTYTRGRGGERKYTGDSGKDSFGNDYSNQPPNMEHIKHNHTYPSRSGSQDSNSSNGSSRFNETEQQRFSRDERRAKALKIPIGIDKVINLPVDAFNELMKKYDMNDAQTALIRDIRRRGKNKVAAQNCRKRKIDAITGIEHTIYSLRAEKDKLVRQRDMIDKETMEMRDRYTQLYNDIFQNLRDDSGDPVDPNEFTLQQMPDGTMFLVPRNGTSTQQDEDRSSADQ